MTLLKKLKICHLTSSRFFGGPERQMLGLAEQLRPEYDTLFLSFAENGLCRAFLERVHIAGFESPALKHDTPRLLAALQELIAILRFQKADIICCHGYKADLIGLLAARRLQIPAIAISRGWTGENAKVRCYEALDRRVLRWMDRVICVSAAQAAKVHAAGVRLEKILVISNAIDLGRFREIQPEYRKQLEALFSAPPARIIGAAGRLSPEKGFGMLVQAAAEVLRHDNMAGFVLFGDGPLREKLQRQIQLLGLDGRFILAGFRADLDCLLPHFDLMVLPSFTEGLPNVVLEAFAAGVPVVATAVGGTPELIEDGLNGYLVPQGNSIALVNRLVELLDNPQRRKEVGESGRRGLTNNFSFDSQAADYRELFAALLPSSLKRSPATKSLVGLSEGFPIR